MVSLGERQLRAARARIADVVLATAPERLGRIRLYPHQRVAAARVMRALERHGGCLLADDVGRGKTYVALAVAREWTRPLVVVPASLRTTWRHAMEQADVAAPFITHEALSRGVLPAFEPDGVVVDESHRFRSPTARRHAALARVTAHARVILLSATPLQNATRDLAAQLAFFLGSAAFGSSDPALARHVIRSPAPRDAELPSVAEPRWIHPRHDDGAVLRAILSLPRPARPFDGGDAGALRTIGLVRAWASSRAALRGALRQRARVAAAIEQCATTGLSPSRRELRAWQSGTTEVQLALAPLLVTNAVGATAKDLLAAVTAERTVLDELSAALASTADPDTARAAALLAVRAAHPGCRILAFSEFATTVRAYYSLFRGEPGVGLLTANEARIASGRLPRDALLARFAPTAHGTREPAPRERVTLLLATDLLSEGVNLQDASVVVHLDLPWNPARLAQRIGRVRRPGGADVVHGYLMAPPARSELLLRVDARLRTKLARAEQTIGRTLPTLPTLTSSVISPRGVGAAQAPDVASAEAFGMVADRIARWQDCRPSCLVPDDEPLTAAAEADQDGWLAVLDDGRLLAQCEGTRSTGGSLLVRAVALADGPARSCTDAAHACARREVSAWLERERLALDCGVGGTGSALDAALERHIALVVHRVARHARAHALRLATQLREMLGQPRSLGAERELERLLEACVGDASRDVEWLDHSLAVAMRSHARTMRRQPVKLVAIIVFGPGSG